VPEAAAAFGPQGDVAPREALGILAVPGTSGGDWPRRHTMDLGHGRPCRTGERHLL